MPRSSEEIVHAESAISDPTPGFWGVAVQKQTARRSARVALIVGTLLTLINQGDTLLAADWQAFNLWKAGLTFLVPYCVATYSAAANAVENAGTE